MIGNENKKTDLNKSESSLTLLNFITSLQTEKNIKHDKNSNDKVQGAKLRSTILQ